MTTWIFRRLIQQSDNRVKSLERQEYRYQAFLFNGVEYWFFVVYPVDRQGRPDLFGDFRPGLLGYQFEEIGRMQRPWNIVFSVFIKLQLLHEPFFKYRVPPLDELEPGHVALFAVKQFFLDVYKQI